MQTSWRLRAIQAGVLVLWAAFNLPALLSYPTPHPDEAWYSSNGYNLVRYGRPGVPIFGDHYGLNRNNTFDGRLYLAGLGAFHVVFGVGLAQARLFALLGGVVAGGFLWETGRRLGGEGPGALAALLFLFSWRVFYAAHRGRPEIWMAAAGAALLWGFWRARDGGSRWGMATLGFAAAAAIDIHLPALHYFLAVGGLVLLDLARRVLDWRRVVAFGLGAVGGFGWWLAVHALPDPALMILQWTHGKPGTPILPQGYGLDYRLAGATEWLRLGTLGATRLGWLEAAAILGSVIVLLWRRKADDVSLLAAGAATLAGFSLLMVSKPLYYIILLAPIVSLWMGQAAFALPTLVERLRLPARLRASLPWVCGGAVLLAYAGGDAVLAWRNRTISFDGYSAALRQIVPPEGGIAGEGTWWFAFPGRAYLTDDYLYEGARDEDEDAGQWLRRTLSEHDVRVVLQDEALSAFPRPSFAGDQARRQAAFEALLAEECTQAGEVTADFYGVDQGAVMPRRTRVWVCPDFD